MKSPEEIVKAATKQGFTVKKITHGWWIYPKGPGAVAYITRNRSKRCDQNNNRDAKRAGVVI